jgi:hypothetical protein
MKQTRCRIRLERKMFQNLQPGSPSMTVATRQVTLPRQLGLPSPRDPNSGEEVEKEEVVKGYECRSDGAEGR